MPDPIACSGSGITLRKANFAVFLAFASSGQGWLECCEESKVCESRAKGYTSKGEANLPSRLYDMVPSGTRMG